MATPESSLQRKTYTVEEAARVLGISRNSAYEAVRLGQVPHLKIGRRIIIPRAALERMLELQPGDVTA
jgi:excisionase family DNA binding protein